MPSRRKTVVTIARREVVLMVGATRQDACPVCGTTPVPASTTPSAEARSITAQKNLLPAVRGEDDQLIRDEGDQ